MVTGRFAIALGAAIAVILSAPFVQQVFAEIGNRWPGQLRAIGIGATAVPAAVAFFVAVLRIRHQRLFRYLAVALGFGVGATSCSPS